MVTLEIVSISRHSASVAHAIFIFMNSAPILRNNKHFKEKKIWSFVSNSITVCLFYD